jgi:hypothetical protein
MKIEIKKKTDFKSEYKITRKDKSTEVINLEIKPYLINHICHFAVEKNLKYSNGFWGMLSHGYCFKEFFRKNNPLAKELRFIEQIVEPVQNTFLGYIPKEKFMLFVNHLDYEISESFLGSCISDVKDIIEKWELLSAGECLMLEWEL